MTDKTSRSMRIHLRKKMKDLSVEQKNLAAEICGFLMKDTKEQVFDMKDRPGSIEMETLNFYRLRVMNQIRFILEASDFVEGIFREEQQLERKLKKDKGK